jgi:hypothetical protein
VADLSGILFVNSLTEQLPRIWLIEVVPMDGTRRETMRTLLATVILFGLGTGLALAGDNNLYAYKTML